MKKFLCMIACFWLLAEGAGAAEIELMTPADSTIPAGSVGNISAGNESWIVRSGRVQLAPQLDSRLGSVSDRDVLKLGLFAASSGGSGSGVVRVEVRGMVRRNPFSGGFVVAGAIPGSALQTALFTVVGDRLMATIEDLEASRIYQIVGDLQTGVGMVTEIDRRKMPPALHLPPLVPGVEERKGEETP